MFFAPTDLRIRSARTGRWPQLPRDVGVGVDAVEIGDCADPGEGRRIEQTFDMRARMYKPGLDASGVIAPVSATMT